MQYAVQRVALLANDGRVYARRVKLSGAPARVCLTAADHGVLSTVHPVRGVDAVPVVYAVDGGFVGVPIDRVKPKSSSRLGRESNLEADPRATLLIEHWDRDDWSRLWWVRATLTHEAAAPSHVTDALSGRLAEAFEQYRDRPFHAILVLRIGSVSGWSASVG